MPIQTVSQAFTNEGVGGFNFRNRIINGDMRIAQRTAGASTSLGSTRPGGYALDRWTAWLANWTSGTATQQQSTDVPSGQGFVNSLLITVTASSSSPDPTSGRFLIHQIIEGFNVADLRWGTASAKSVTISFWVKSSVTGNYGFTLTNNASNRGYVVSYAINSANTWEQKTITIPGDTSGTWTTDNTDGITLNFDLGVNGPTTDTVNTWLTGDYRGLTSGVDLIRTNGATFYLTGVQFEVGSVATEFERRPYGTELALCQRYYYRLKQPAASNSGVAAGVAYTTTAVYGQVNFPVEMRTNPTALEQNGTAADYDTLTNGNLNICTSVPAFENATVTTSLLIWRYSSSTVTVGSGAICRMRNPTSYLAWSAEL
jgi:hypothetical protein